ncbi:MAG: type II toxin-antitoxin system HicA family toxin [Euryarchaeota archaeon]|nr:type II toxin-antitoxin system HicA family toxin [Euryarchaeota archaeon]
MARLPVLRARGVLAALRRAGFERVGQHCSHVRLKGIVRGATRVVVVPNHPEIAPGTLLSIIRQSGLTRKEFERLLR